MSIVIIIGMFVVFLMGYGRKRRKKMKRKYVKPTVTRIVLDNTISLVMMSHHHGHDKPPKPPKPKGAFDSPFQSPFN